MAVLLVRHAAAGDRRSSADDVARPLDKRGRRQAARLVDALAPFEVTRVLASPAVRCVATVEPVAAARGIDVAADDALFEGNGAKAIALVRSLLEPGSGVAEPGAASVVLCSHGDVIPEILEDLARQGADLGMDQRCQKGSVWALHHRPDGGIAGRYVPPPA